jgi:hypothetical protein
LRDAVRLPQRLHQRRREVVELEQRSVGRPPMLRAP